MRFKLDENLGRRGAALLVEAGHDARTVADQDLCAAADNDLIKACAGGNRCLVTLDLGFANPIVYPPARFSGIAVLRLPARPSPDDLSEALRTLVVALRTESIQGKMWVVQRGRIRQYRPEDSTE